MVQVATFATPAWPYLVASGAMLLTVACLVGLYYFVVLPLVTPLKRLPGPAPTSVIFGNGWEIFERVSNFPEPFLSWMKHYGGAVHYSIACEHRIQLTDPTAVQYVLATKASSFPRHPTLRRFFADFLSGVGLLSSEGAKHDYHRKVLNPHFSGIQIKTSMAVIVDQTLRFCASHLDSAAMSRRPANMNTFFQELTLNNIGLSSFGYDFQANPDALNAYEALQTMPNKVLLACSMCIPGFSRLPFPCFRRRNHARTTLLRIMQDIITTKLSEHKAAGAPRDLLDLMLDADTCSHDALVHTMTLIFAGHDTTTAALCWTFFRLASQPSMAALARNECLAMLKRHGSFENGEALQGLSFTTACIQETLRLHPPVPFLGRRIAAQDMDVPMTDGSSIFVPKGTSVCVLHAAMHRDPTYWSQPEAFVPERFIPGMVPFEIDLGLRQGRSHALHYMPFSIGAKNCIGQRFAMAELQVVVATLLSRYEFAITADADFSNMFNGVSVQPAHLELSVVSV